MSERRAFLERSLADLEEEHDAGDLTDADYERLKADYERHLDVLDGRAKPAKPPAPPRRRGARVAVAVGVLAFAVLAGVLMAQASGRRLPGATSSGGGPAGTAAASTGTTTTLAPDLARCLDLASGEALDCYLGYTSDHPDDPDGFFQFGLFAITQGVQSDNDDLLAGGETFLRRALQIDPGHLAARVNLAVLLERQGRDAEAQQELDRLEGVELPPDLQQLADFVRSNLASP